MEPEKKTNGAMVGLVIIVIILIIGGIYMWQASKSKQAVENPIGITTGEQSQAKALSNQDATSLNALDQDLQTTDTNTGVDASAVN